jgi:hypothetical protein
MKKMKTEDILKKIEELEDWDEIRDFILSLELTKEQFEVLSENEAEWVRWGIANHPNLPKDLMYKLAEDEYDLVKQKIAYHPDLPEYLVYKMTEDKDEDVRRAISEHPYLPDDLIIRLCCDYWNITSRDGFDEKLEKPKNLKAEDLENAYDLIRTSKYISRKEFERTFNYIISNFPDLAEAAKLFKSIILKGKKDLK